MIRRYEATFAVRLMCRLLGVPVSSYYDWRRRPVSRRDQANRELTVEIKRVFDAEKGRSGSPRVTKRLHTEGFLVNRKRVASIMRANAWRAKAAKKFKATTNSLILPIHDGHSARRMDCTTTVFGLVRLEQEHIGFHWPAHRLAQLLDGTTAPHSSISP